MDEQAFMEWVKSVDRRLNMIIKALKQEDMICDYCEKCRTKVLCKMHDHNHGHYQAYENWGGESNLDYYD